MRARLGPVLIVVVLLVGTSACSSDGASRPSTTATSAASGVPPTDTVEALHATAIDSTPSPDWVMDSPQGVWVANAGDGLVRYGDDGEVTASVTMTDDVVLGMEVGFGALWAADRDDEGRVRITRVDLADPSKVVRGTAGYGQALQESSMAVTDDSVWLVADRGGSRDLVSVDPSTMRATTVRTFEADEGDPGGLRGGFGSLWLTDVVRGTVLRLDPADGSTLSEISVGAAPVFLSVGPEAVWVMVQADGAVARVDPATDTVAATVQVTGGPIDGGDIVATPSAVWVRTSAELAVRLDPATDEVVRRIGPASGSGSIAVHGDDLWISAHDVTTVWRVPGVAAP